LGCEAFERLQLDVTPFGVLFLHWNSVVNSIPLLPLLHVLFLLFEVGCKKIGREEVGSGYDAFGVI